MGRTPCCTKMGLNRGPWTPEEDRLLSNYIQKHGEGRWRTLPKKAGLLRCGKSCRLRWMNYLRPDVKRGQILPEEEDLILKLHRLLGNRWSLIAGRIPGRTDNEVKNYWNTHLSRKLISQGIDPRTHRPLAESELDNHSPNEGNNKVDSENELNPSSGSQYKNPETAPVDANIETSKLFKDTELPETSVAGSLRDITDINASNTIMAPVFKDTRSCNQDSSNAANIARKLIPYCNASSELGVQDQDASLYLRRNLTTNRYFMAPATTVSGLENTPGFPDSITENPTNEGHSVNFGQFNMQQRQMLQGIRMDVSPITAGATSEDYNSDIFSDFLDSFMGGEDQLREESNKHVGSSQHRQQFLHTETPVHLGYNMWSILSPPSQLPERQ